MRYLSVCSGIEAVENSLPAGWSHDERCPPEDLRWNCCEDCAACFEKATEAMKRG